MTTPTTSPMRATDFCFWLLGPFELCHLITFTADQRVCIRGRLTEVRSASQVGQPAAAIEFCDWLNGALDMLNSDDPGHAQIIKNRLTGVIAQMKSKPALTTGDVGKMDRSSS